MAVRDLTEESGVPRRSEARRTFALGCGALLLVVLLAVLGYLSWANHLPPAPVESRTYPHPNGFDACAAAAAKLPQSAQITTLGQPLDADPAALRQALAPYRGALDELRRAERLEYMNPAYRSYADRFPYLASYRQGARMFVAESTVALADGKPGAAMERTLDAMELGSRVGRGGVLIHGLVAIAVSAIGISGGERPISQLTAEEAHAAGQRLDRIIAQSPTAAEAMAEERYASLSGVRQMFQSKADMSQMGISPPILANPLLVRFYPKPLTYRAIDSFIQAEVAELKRPYPAQRPVPLPRDPLAQNLAPAFATLGFLWTRNLAELRLLRLELALQEYRARRGAYPTSLAELAPAAVTAVPPDPFIERPFVYRRTASGYVLYSVGPDGVDDGGSAFRTRAVDQTTKGDLVAGHLHRRPASAPRPQQ